KFEQTISLAKLAHRPLQDIIEYIGPHGLPRGIKLSSGIRVHRSMAKSGQIELLISLREGPSGKPFGLLSIFSATPNNSERDWRIPENSKPKIMESGHSSTDWRRPGYSSLVRSRDGVEPFLRFVECAATDAGRPPAEDWYRALVSALDTLERYERLVP